MDIASLVGMVVAIILVVFSIVADKGFKAIHGFLDWKSALITFGGAFMGMMVTQASTEI